MNKRGETPIWLIIALVLGLLVLVVLALGFTGGWGQLWDRMTGWTGGTGTVTSVGQACQVACSSMDANAYCRQNREIEGLTQAQITALVASVDSSYGVNSSGDNLVVQNSNGSEVSGMEVTGSEGNYGVDWATCEDLVDKDVISIGSCDTSRITC